MIFACILTEGWSSCFWKTGHNHKEDKKGTHIIFNEQDEITTTMAEMSKEEIARFVTQGTLTGKLATVRNDGSSHVVPIWFVLDNENSKRRGKIGNIIFTTDRTSVKANNIRRNDRVSICIDDQIRPFSFVTIFGSARILPHKQKEILKWATKIAERYMGKKNAEAYGRRNSSESEVLVRINPTRIIAEKNIAGWDQ
ncbi:MAG TPA: PPOX class F420-dependent oxidoreductase [Candidatus Nitrosopolaris sp.]|nr:PPOX class F420-dependent oxidoreductase [Candidatus Nitrosopolaris sp.]